MVKKPKTFIHEANFSVSGTFYTKKKAPWLNYRVLGFISSLLKIHSLETTLLADKKAPLTKEDIKNNKKVSVERIVSDKYRNRRKRFGLRFNLIAGIYNFEINL